MELGIYTFADTAPDPVTGAVIPTSQRLAELMEEIELADSVGLDVFGLGEHHRPDYAVSAPSVVLGAAAARTKNVRLTSAVTVLSSEDPVRVYQQYATLDLLSGGRAEIRASHCSARASTTTTTSSPKTSSFCSASAPRSASPGRPAITARQ